MPKKKPYSCFKEAESQYGMIPIPVCKTCRDEWQCSNAYQKGIKHDKRLKYGGE